MSETLSKSIVLETTCNPYFLKIVSISSSLMNFALCIIISVASGPVDGTEVQFASERWR